MLAQGSAIYGELICPKLAGINLELIFWSAKDPEEKKTL